MKVRGNGYGMLDILMAVTVLLLASMLFQVWLDDWRDNYRRTLHYQRKLKEQRDGICPNPGQESEKLQQRRKESLPQNPFNDEDPSKWRVGLTPAAQELCCFLF